MLCSDIIKVIEDTYPKEAALDFDNVGLLAGRTEKEVGCVYLALDATGPVIEDALKAGADMLITHHPLIFSPLKAVTDQDFIGKRILCLIQNDLSYYAMHTNYDVLGMAELSGRLMGREEPEVLDVTRVQDGKPEGIGRVGKLPVPLTLEECSAYVRHKLKLGPVKVFGSLDLTIRRMAISPGSGKSAVEPALEKGADVLVTGDMGHHEGIDAWEQGLSVIDAGHYGTEYIFMEDMEKFLARKLPGLKVVTAPAMHPFQIL